MAFSGRKPFGELTANVGNKPEARTQLLSPKPQSLRFRDLLGRSSTDPSWARRVRTALCGAEQTLMQEFIAELASVLAALFAVAPPSVDLYALVTHVLAYGGIGANGPWLDGVLPCFIAHDTPELEDSIKMVLLNGHPRVAEKLLACLLSTAAASACPTHVQAAAAVGIEAVLYAWPDAALRRYSAVIWDTLIALSCATRKCVQEPWESAMNAASHRQSADSEGVWSAAAASVLAACGRSGAPPPRLPATPAELLHRSPGITPSPRAGGVLQEPMSASAASEAASVASVETAYSAASWTHILGGADSHTGLTPMLDGLNLLSPPAQPKPDRVTFTPVPWNLSADSSPLAAQRTAAASPVSAPLLPASPARYVARGSTSTTAGARMVTAAVLVLGVALLAAALLSSGRQHTAHMLSVHLPTCDGTCDEFGVERARAVAEEAPLAAPEPIVVEAVVAPAARASTVLVLVQSVPEEPVEAEAEEAELVTAFEPEVDAAAAPEAETAAVEGATEAAVEPQAALEADVAHASAADATCAASGSELPEKAAAGASASSTSVTELSVTESSEKAAAGGSASSTTPVTESSVAAAPDDPEEGAEAEPPVPMAGEQAASSPTPVTESSVAAAPADSEEGAEAEPPVPTAGEQVGDVSAVQVDTAPVALALTDMACLDSEEEQAVEAQAPPALATASPAEALNTTTASAAQEAGEAQAPLVLVTASPAEALNTTTASAARVVTAAPGAALRSGVQFTPCAARWAVAVAPRLTLGVAAASGWQLDLVWAPLTPRCPAKCGLAPNNVSRALHGLPALERGAGSIEPVASYNASRTRARVAAPTAEVPRTSDAAPATPSTLTPSAPAPPLLCTPVYAGRAQLSVPLSLPAPPLHTPVYAGRALLSAARSQPAPPLLYTPTGHQSVALSLVPSRTLTVWAPPIAHTVATRASHAHATSAVRGRAPPSLALVRHGRAYLLVAEPHARVTLTARPFARVPSTRPTSLLAAAIRASTQVATPSVPAAVQQPGSLAVPLLRSMAAVSTLASSAQSARPPPAATLSSTLVSRPALLMRPFLVPEAAPACAAKEAEEAEEGEEAWDWEATARAAARAILAYQPLLRAAVLAGSLLGLLGLVLLHALGRGGDGAAGGERRSAAAADSKPASKGANAAALLLREVSIGTPVAVARAARDAALIEESGVSALKALAGRTPVRIRGSVAGLLRGLAQATPPSAYVSFEARDAEEQEVAPKALIGLLAATETPA